MISNSNDILKSMPDFDDFRKLSEEIRDLMYQKLSLDAQIKAGESEVFKALLLKPTESGKPLAVNAIENLYKFPGINGELLPLRAKLAEASSQLEAKRLLFDVYKTMIDVWRTMSSNERGSTL